MEKLCWNGRTFSKEEFQNLELPKCAKVQIDFKDCKNMEFSISDEVKLTYMDHVLTLDLGNCGSGRTIRKVWIEELTDLTLLRTQLLWNCLLIREARYLLPVCMVNREKQDLKGSVMPESRYMKCQVMNMAASDGGIEGV